MREECASANADRVAGRPIEKRRIMMSVAKVTEISCSSPTSFEDAIEKGIERADKTLDKVKGAWVSEMKVEVDDGKVSAYRVNLKVTFVLKG
jgi:flavin-binding protein dodecin